MTGFLLFVSLGHAAPPTPGPVCMEPATLDDFQAAARAGERAFADIDLPGLTRARLTALASLPCLAEPITPAMAAEFHRMMAMAAFTSGDESAVLEEFHAARRLDPGYTIPPDVAPAGHPLVLLYEASAGEVAPHRELESVIPPEGGRVIVDGTAEGLRVSGLSALLQVYREDGTLTRTEYLLSTDPTPRYGPRPVDREQQRKHRIGFTAATASAAVLATGLYGTAAALESQFWDTSQPLRVPARTQSQVNSLVVGSAGVATLALGLGIYTAWTW